MNEALHLVEQMAPIDAVISLFHQEYPGWVSNIDTQEKLTSEVLTNTFYY